MAATPWHYSIAGKKYGPVSAADLKRLASSGELSPTDLVWKEGLETWVVASKVKGLFAQHAAAASGNPGATPPLPPMAETPVVASAAGSPPIHTQRVATAAAAVLGGLATFMPWAHLPVVGAVDGTIGDGWITLGLFGVVLFLALSGNRGLPLHGWSRLTAIVLPIVASMIGAAKIVSITSIASDLAANAQSGTLGGAMAGLMATAVRPKFGLYALVLMGVATAAAALLLSPQRISLPRIPSLPVHSQRIGVASLAVLGIAATFLPWLRAVDDEPVFLIDAPRSPAQLIVVAGAINRSYAAEMGKHMGKNAETILDIRTANGLGLTGAVTFVLFATAMSVGLHGVLTREIKGWMMPLVMIPPLIASGIGLWEVMQVSRKDQAVRKAVQDFATESGIRQSLPRLDDPVLRTAYGLWVVVVAGVATSAAVPLLGLGKRA